MGLLINNNILFVHIPKTGGTSIITNFIANNGTNCNWEGCHAPLGWLHKKCESMLLDVNKMDILSVVRNPWAKMYSTWRYFKILEWSEFYSGDDTIDSDFNNWIKWVYTGMNRSIIDRGDVKFNLFKMHYTNQLNWFKDTDGNMLRVDTIMKTEELSDKMHLIAAKYGWHRWLRGKVNATKDNVTKPYHEMYNQESIDLVAEHFAEDIAMFNYEYTI